MIFYGNGTVWDKANNKSLCRFKNGKFETNDHRTKKILKELNYRYDEEVIELNQEEFKNIEEEVQTNEVKVDYNEYNIKELRDLAKEKGIEGIYNKTKAELIKVIEGD